MPAKCWKSSFGRANFSKSNALFNQSCWHRKCSNWCWGYIFGTNEHWQISGVRLQIWSIKSADSSLRARTLSPLQRSTVLPIGLHVCRALTATYRRGGIILEFVVNDMTLGSLIGILAVVVKAVFGQFIIRGNLINPEAWAFHIKQTGDS